MSDLHQRFGDWLADGARSDLPRDAALHASACDACLRDVAAFDALLAIDPGAAPPPVLDERLAIGRPPLIRALRAASGVAAALLLAASVGIGAGALLDQRTQLGASVPTPTPAGEGILGGGGGPAASADLSGELPSPGSSADVSSHPAPTPESGASAAPGTVATPAPVATPRPTTIITPPVGTPRPSASGAATPAPTAPPPSVTPGPTLVPTPVPTAIPTPTPTAMPTPTPAPTPTPTPQCSDGEDNDGDGLIDFGLDPVVNDPDCLSPDDDEAGLLP